MAKCHTCSEVRSYYGSTTSNLIKHLELMHPEIHKQYSEEKVKKKPKKSDVFYIDLVNFFLDAGIPLSSVGRNSFKNFCKNQGYEPISRTTMNSIAEEQCNITKKRIQNCINHLKYVCTTVDLWTSRRKVRTFLGVTCHGLTNDFQRVSFALACKRVYGSQNFSAIYEELQKIHKDSNLSTSKIVKTVTDNGSNFKKAFAEFGLKNFDSNGNDIGDENDDDDEDDGDDVNFVEYADDMYLPDHERCASHTLNLIATTDYLKHLSKQPALLILHKRVRI